MQTAEFKLAELVHDHTFMTGFAQSIFGHPAITLSEQDVRRLRRRIPTYIAALRAADLLVTLQYAEAVLRELENGEPQPDGSVLLSGGALGDIQSSMMLIVEGIRAELNTKSFVAISPQRRHLFEDGNHFGDLVSEKFPSLTFNINEAGKCLALSRWTAGAYHAILCLEAGVRAIARHLSIPDPMTGAGRNWSAVSRSIEDEMKKRWPMKSDQLRADYLGLDRVYGALKATVNPYRNETMHLSSRYDEHEAAHIFEMAKGILQQVAMICDEEGLPLADQPTP